MKNIGFIGMGNMALAIAGGFIKSGKVQGGNIFAYAPNQEKLRANAAKLGFNAEPSLGSMIAKCDTVIVACKPYQVQGVLGARKLPCNTRRRRAHPVHHAEYARTCGRRRHAL